MVTFFLIHPNRDKSAIYILISTKGSKYRRSTGESTLVKFWNAKKKRVKSTSDNPTSIITNDILNKLESAAVRATAHFKEYYHAPSPTEFFAVMDKEFFQDDPTVDKTPLFAEYLQIYIDRYKGSKDTSTVRKYVTTLNKIIAFEKVSHSKLRFEDINIEFYNNFKKWFYNLGYSDNYFGNIIKVIKQVYKEARIVDKFHNGEDIAHRDFITVRKSADSIYLTEQELTKIKHLDISEELILHKYPEITIVKARQKIQSLKKVRNRFLVGAYTGLRVSDYGRLCDINIDGDFIRIKTTKTKQDLIIPIHHAIADIVADGLNEKNKLSDQKMNKHLKELGWLAGIDDVVVFNKSVGGETKEVIYKKYELISTHTARRSFATNSYKAGVNTMSIRAITGHTTETEFMKYIKVSAEENAEMLLNHPYYIGDKE